MKIDNQYKTILLEALEDMMYKLSLQLDKLKGGPLTQERKTLTKKQKMLEALQHLVSNSSSEHLQQGLHAPVDLIE